MRTRAQTCRMTAPCVAQFRGVSSNIWGTPGARLWLVKLAEMLSHKKQALLTLILRWRSKATTFGLLWPIRISCLIALLWATQSRCCVDMQVITIASACTYFLDLLVTVATVIRISSVPLYNYPQDDKENRRLHLQNKKKQNLKMHYVSQKHYFIQSWVDRRTFVYG